MGAFSSGRQRPTIEVGGRIFTDLDNLVILHGYTAGNLRCTLRKPNASAGYQVPVSKKFVVKAMRVWANTTGNGYGTLGYSDNDVGQNSATALTNGVFLGGDASIDASGSGKAAQAASGAYVQRGEGLTNFEVPAGKYISMTGSQTQYIIFGYEVDV